MLRHSAGQTGTPVGVQPGRSVHGTRAPAAPAPAPEPGEIVASLHRIRERLHVVDDGPGSAIRLVAGAAPPPAAGRRVLGVLPPQYPEWLGDRSFCEAHQVRFPYVAGEMARGISTTRMVIAMASAEMLSFFGAGGLASAQVAQAVDELHRALPGRTNWGVNLLHSPSEPRAEDETADLLIRRRVPCVSASAYLDLTPAVVRCAASGLRLDRSGRVVRPIRMMAKLSRPEVAERFLSPSPREILRELVDRGELSREEAALAERVPVAEDVTVESDSGGHTDNRPLGALLPVIQGLRDQLARRYGHGYAVRVGAAGGLGTPTAVAAAFAAGADYVVTGTVNQLSVESGLSESAKQLLAEAAVADCAMAPAADMFETGVNVQVLRRGTLFAARASRMYDLYCAYQSLDELPAAERTRLEREVFRRPIDEVWDETRAFWLRRDPAQAELARRDPKHRMALVFRWYLGMSSGWAARGETGRKTDYQIWCGPAMGAFNQWRAGSFLADPAACEVVQIALNLLEGAAVASRAQQARSHGVAVPAAAFAFVPRPLS